MSRRTFAALLVMLGCSTAFVHDARAQELLEPRTTDRKFPQGVFCPFPLELSFIADGPTAKLRFSTTTVNYFNTNDQANKWSKQRLDNICVVPDKIYLANLGPLGTYSSDCYIGAPLTQTFYFQNAGTIPLKELFDSDPAADWDLTHGAYWNPSETGPNDPGTEGSFTPTGCLGLGTFDTTLALTDSAFTTRVVSGLTKGVTYHLTAWWDVQDMQLDKIFLTVAVLSDGGTPIARQTWGAVRRRYSGGPPNAVGESQRRWETRAGR